VLLILPSAAEEAGPSRATAGLGNILTESPNILVGPLWGENVLIFLFKMVHSGVLYIFERWRGPLKVTGPGVAYPLYPTLSTGLRRS